jgi:hypothetical protein
MRPDEAKHDLLVLGLPETGKTSFLAALSYVTRAGEVPTVMSLADYQPDEKYITEIKDDWMDFKVVPRHTDQLSAKPVVLSLKDAETAYELGFPDVSGEIVLYAWTTRQWPRFFEELVKQSSAAIVFVHSTSYEQGITIDPVTSKLVALTRKALATPVAEPKDFDPDKVPTQVRLVDLLQLIRRRQEARSAPTAILVSAWDLVIDARTPSAWLQEEMPLLYQYLQSGATKFPYKVFGISATGGDPVKDRERLSKLPNASSRINVWGASEHPSHDLSLPLTWLLKR